MVKPLIQYIKYVIVFIGFFMGLGHSETTDTQQQQLILLPPGLSVNPMPSTATPARPLTMPLVTPPAPIGQPLVPSQATQSTVVGTPLMEESEKETSWPQLANQKETPILEPPANTTQELPKPELKWLDMFSVKKWLGLDDNSRLQVYSFGSTGFLITNNSALYTIQNIGTIRDRMDFAAAMIKGLQVSFRITSRIAAVAQVAINGDNSNGRKPPVFMADWIYLRFNPFASNDVQLRLGRFRIPALIYSETELVRYTYPWVTLPNEVYGIVPVTNLNGFEAVYRRSIGDTNWDIKMQPFYGFEDDRRLIFQAQVPPFQPPLAGTVVKLHHNNIIGTSFTLGNAYITLNALFMHFKTTANAVLAAAYGRPFPNLFTINNSSTQFYSIGAKFNYKNFIAITEYDRRETPSQLASLQGYYVMAGYRFGKFLPSFTYARVSTTNTAALIRVGGQRPIAQYSLTLALAYYFTNNWVGKVSATQITPLDGTYGFFNQNPGRKHIMLYGVSLDAIF